MVFGEGSNSAMMQRMMRGMFSGMSSMMKDMSVERESSNSCCGGMFAGENSGQLADLAKQCRPLLEQMMELIED